MSDFPEAGYEHPQIYPLAGGKGGVGKTIVTANLALALASRGLKIIAADLDLGGSNLHTALGVENPASGIGAYANRGASSLTELIVPTPYDNLSLIAGDTMLTGMANIAWWFKKKLTRELAGLDADIVLLDLGAGSSYNILDFFLVSDRGILISTPEPTSMVNAYAFLKNIYFRKLLRLFPARSPERERIGKWAYENRETGKTPIEDLPEVVDAVSAGSGDIIRKGMGDFRPRILMNDVRSAVEESAWRKLAAAVKNGFGMDLTHLGSLPYDPEVRTASFRRKPLYDLNPSGAFSTAMEVAASCILTE